MKQNTPTILIIIGISGDLSQRKLLPAIGQIAAAGELPKDFRVVGITRNSDVTFEQLLHKTDNRTYLENHGELFQMDLSDEKEYQRLAQHLLQIEKTFPAQAQRLYYLSIPPQISRPVIELLSKSGLAQTTGTKLLLEKPFGVDLASAKELIQHINHYFSPEQVYRIDHYLAKETAQNLIVFRNGNPLFNKTWNNEFIERIEILASEEIGIEGRKVFYEQTGALRDLVQSHLLQLTALTLMKISAQDQLEDIPDRRLAALKYLRLPEGKEVKDFTRRAQYQGYAEEVENPGTTVETFTSIQLISDDPDWVGVPIQVTTGKSLKTKRTEIKITYKHDETYAENELVIRLQPDEGVSFSVWAKQPGYAHTVTKHILKFAYKEHYQTLPEAYEQVLYNAINSDRSLFASSEEVLETWRLLDPIQQMWEMSDEPLQKYAVGTSAEELLEHLTF